MLVLRYPLAGRVLDACAGKGAIFRWFRYVDAITEPLACELDWGIDFLKFNEKVDFVVMNCPYSLFTEFITHAMSISDNIVLICPMYKWADCMTNLNAVREYGNIVEELVIGPGDRIGWRFGFPVAIYYLKRGYRGDTKKVFCDYTLKHCKRVRRRK